MNLKSITLRGNGIPSQKFDFVRERGLKGNYVTAYAGSLSLGVPAKTKKEALQSMVKALKNYGYSYRLPKEMRK